MLAQDIDIRPRVAEGIYELSAAPVQRSIDFDLSTEGTSHPIEYDIWSLASERARRVNRRRDVFELGETRNV